MDDGYGELGNELIRIFQTWPIDFDAAEALLRKGADLNAPGKNDDENILSEILLGFWEVHYYSDDYKEKRANDDEFSPIHDPESGEAMLKVIRFFLDNGFDVHRNEDRYGAQCLSALILSTYDAAVIAAAKMLFDAGAKNVKDSPENYGDTPKDNFSVECSSQQVDGNYHLANIFEAVYEIFVAHEEGRDYSKIDSYETAVGKRIHKVLAGKPEFGKVFYDLTLSESTYRNCFDKWLYFAYDTGVLITTGYGEFWVDGVLPNAETVDVSDAFPGIVGSVIESISFDHNEIVKGIKHYGQPISTLHMDSGTSVTFTTNFGEAEEEKSTAYYRLN